MSAFQWRNPETRSGPGKMFESDEKVGGAWTRLAYAKMAARQNSCVTRSGHTYDASEGEDETCQSAQTVSRHKDTTAQVRTPWA
jgi:hypothetical protein